MMMAASEWDQHGCTAHYPEQSKSSEISQEWADYYKNIYASDIVKVFKLNEVFMEWEMGLYDNMSLGLWGIKK